MSVCCGGVGADGPPGGQGAERAADGAVKRRREPGQQFPGRGQRRTQHTGRARLQQDTHLTRTHH
jgi:hypothetical protein